MTSSIFDEDNTKQFLQKSGVAYTEEERIRQVYDRVRHQTLDIKNDFICVEFESLEDLLEFKRKVNHYIIIEDSDESDFDFEIEIYDSDRE